MTKKFKLPGWVWVPLLIPLLIGLYFAENIKGQVRFMQYCWREGGLKVYEPLERGVGWWADDFNDAKTAAQLTHVDFVRFLGRDGNKYDMKYVGGSPHREKSFEVIPSNDSQVIRYSWSRENEKIINEIRLSKTSYEVLSIPESRLLVRYYSFSYSQFNPNTSLGSSGVSCFRGADSINSAFID